MADQRVDTIDVIASEPDARHPMLDGAPVMIGDILVAGHPDDPYHRIEFHVGSLMYDDGRDLDSEVDRGWTVSPISIEFEDDAPYEWPLSECKRVSAPGFQVVPIVDDATRGEVEALCAFLLDAGSDERICNAVDRARELLSAAYLGRTD